MIKRTSALCLLLLSHAGLVSAQSAANPEETSLDERAQFYDERYALGDVFEKLTDNHGNGFEPLYGTRNFRAVLNGVAYRGGANNSWNRTGHRDNRNPLPQIGLESLCSEGFDRAYYLYTTNFESAPPQTDCESGASASNTLTYLQRSATDEQQAYEILESIHAAIRDARHGPIYLQCWNGWHASGLIAAKVLRQFCGLSADEAIRYWDANTDGHNSEPRYERIRQRIRDFTPYPEFTITKDEAAAVCPSF